MQARGITAVQGIERHPIGSLDEYLLAVDHESKLALPVRVGPIRHLEFDGPESMTGLPLRPHPFLLVGREPVPGREVELRAGLVDLVGEKPGERSHFSVPGPYGLVGVAVVARLAQYRSHGGGRRDVLLDRRIGPIDRDELDSGGGWALLNQIENVLSRTRLNPEDMFAGLSAGMKRRTLFARALASNPDLLLLDEPTNHLDIDTIIWMESYILRHVKTLLFVTHDRAFLKNIANRIIELDRGRLISYGCNYTTYLKRRQDVLDAEEKQNWVFDKKLSQEEAWIRKGIKARRTRNEGRVRSLEKMRAAYRTRRGKIGDVRLQAQEAERTGKLVIEAKAVSFSYRQTPIVRNLSTVIMRGDKVGIIGPNGVGKTTLLKILAGEEDADLGTVDAGYRAALGYYAQEHEDITPGVTVLDLMRGASRLPDRDLRTVLGHFLLADKVDQDAGTLSGGEKTKLALARLVVAGHNVLLLDEPTNNLDPQAKEALLEALQQYEGTLVLVSHDTDFVADLEPDRVILMPEGDGAYFDESLLELVALA